MFQSLKSRTYENLQALFSGKVNTQQTFSTLAMPPEKLKLESTFKPLQEKGTRWPVIGCLDHSLVAGVRMQPLSVT